MRRVAPKKKALIKPLSYKETVVQAIAPVTVFMLVGLGLPALIKTNLDHQNVWDTLVEGGQTLSGELGWILPVIITALLGFLTAALAANSYIDAVEADQLRRTLGGIGFLLGASGVLVGLYVSVFAVNSENWALLIGLFPAIVLIGFLALHIGRYVALSEGEKLQALDAVIIQRKTRMKKFEKRSNWPWWVALSVCSATTAMLAVATALALNSEPTLNKLLFALVGGFLASLAILTIGRYILVSVYTDLSRTRFMTWVLPLFLFLIVVLAIVTIMWHQYGTWAGFGSMVVAGGSLFAQAFPRKYQWQGLLNVTINGSAAATAYEWFAVQEAKDLKERARLLANLAQEERQTWQERVRAMLGGSPDKKNT